MSYLLELITLLEGRGLLTETAVVWLALLREYPHRTGDINAGWRAYVPGGGLVRVVVLAANPDDTAPLDLEEEARQIDAELRVAGRFRLQRVEDAGVAALQAQLLDGDQAIVHFSGHGAGVRAASGHRDVELPKDVDVGRQTAGLVLLGADRRRHIVSASAVIGMFAALADAGRAPRGAVFSACHTAHLAEALAAHVDFAVGMAGAIPDPSAIAFSRGFYAALVQSPDPRLAWRWGNSAIEARDLGGHDLARLYASDGRS